MKTVKATITKDQSKTALEFPILVRPGTKELLLEGWYEPAVLECQEKARNIIVSTLDAYLTSAGEELLGSVGNRWPDSIIEFFKPVRNQINYSLFDPTGEMRGRVTGDRFFQRVQLGEQTSSVGCVSGPIPSGEWHLVLDVHELVTEQVEIAVTVSMSTMSSPLVETAKLQAEETARLVAKPVCIQGGGPGWYRGDFHVHSHHSDGQDSVDRLLTVLSQRGYDFFALTDHNLTTGWRSGLDALSSVVVIPGIEITTFFGHALALNYEHYVAWHHLRQDTSLGPLVEEVQQAGGLFAVAHPNTVGDPLCAGCKWMFTALPWRAVDLLELWNGSWTMRRFEILRTLKDWEGMLNQGMRVIAISGTDTHTLDPPPDGWACSYVWAEKRTRNGIVSGLRAGKVFLSQGPMIEVMLWSGDQKASLGENLTVTPGDCLTVEVKTSEPVEIEVIRCGDSLLRTSQLSSSLQLEDTPTGSSWYNVRIWIGRTLLGLTNPVWVTLDSR